MQTIAHHEVRNDYYNYGDIGILKSNLMTYNKIQVRLIRASDALMSLLLNYEYSLLLVVRYEVQSLRWESEFRMFLSWIYLK